MTAPVLLASDGCDRATAYHMSNKVARHRDGVFVTWLDAQYRVILAQLDPDTGAVRRAFPLAQGHDNHCGAALAVTGDQVLHVMAGSHALGGFVYRYSATPADPASWSLPQGVGAACTYPCLVARADLSLMLAYRHTNFGSRWSTIIQERSPAGAWSWPLRLVNGAADNYIYPTNSLVVGPDGVTHLGNEFYKTFAGDAEPGKSMAVTRLYNPPRDLSWYQDDGRKVNVVPVGIEDTVFIAHDPQGDLRPGNLHLLPDGRPCIGLWNARLGTLTLHVRTPGTGAWRVVDLTAALTAPRPGWRANAQGRLAMGPDGSLVVVSSLAPEVKFGHPQETLRVLWLNPETLTVTRSWTVPKADPERATWLASLEHAHVGLPAQPLVLLFTDGNLGRGCTNDARCHVRGVVLTDDLKD